MTERCQTGDAPRSSTEGGPEGTPPALRVLTIGEVPPQTVTPGGAARRDILAPEEINAAAIARIAPDIVLTPLFGAGYDCLDIALALCAAGFRGRLRAVVSFVPNPALVRREIAASCPGLDFDLIVTGPPGRPGAARGQ